jgi:hypothetical protein
LESDWDLSQGRKMVGVLTWYAHSDADQTVSLSSYDLSATMTYGAHNMNGLSGTVSQTGKGHIVHIDVMFQDVDDAKYVAHAVGAVTCWLTAVTDTRCGRRTRQVTVDQPGSPSVHFAGRRAT